MMRDDHAALGGHPFWDDVVKGMTLPIVRLHVSMSRAIQNVAAGRDYMRGHHETAYAQRQGQPGVFLNTTFHQAFIDRVVTDWAGPLAFITRRRMQMADAILAGDTVQGEGRVMQVREDEQGRGLVDVLVSVNNGRTRCTQAKVTVRMPKRGTPWHSLPASAC